MADFARIPGGDTTYPMRGFDGQEDQSYGFLDAYKVQSGRSRGENRVQGSYIVNDDVVDRLFMGKQPDGEVKIKLSQENVDVKTATDSQLIWSSDFNNLKVGTIVEQNRAVNNAGVIGAQYPHGLDYTPSFVGYSWSNDPGNGGLSRTFFSTGAAPQGASSYGIASSVDETNVYVTWVGGSATTYTAYVKIYLFRESAQ